MTAARWYISINIYIMQIFAKTEIRPPIAAHTGNLRIYKHIGLIVLCMQTFAVLSKSFETSFGSCIGGKTVCTVLMSFESRCFA